MLKIQFLKQKYLLNNIIHYERKCSYLNETKTEFCIPTGHRTFIKYFKKTREFEMRSLNNLKIPKIKFLTAALLKKSGAAVSHRVC